MRVHTLMMAIIAVVAACSDTPAPMGAPDRPSPDIADGAHSGGNQFFFFLPPMAGNPGSGTNATGLSPVVDICAGTGSGCTGSVAHFTTNLATTTTTQPGNSETVRDGGDGYIVDWHTGDFNLAVGGLYRICVTLDSHPLGHADVDVVGSGKDLKSVDTDEFIALLDGRTLPIKFRIQAGASSEPSDPGCGSQAE
jgi:hypothetical protein